jgi:DNA-binding MarR family transcriptional regulator
MPQPSPDIESLAQALYSLSAIRRDLQRCAGIEHAVVGLTTLGAVHRLGPARISDIAGDLQVNLSVASRQIQALEDDGLVDRVSDPHDRRSSLVALSAAGKAKLEHAHQRLVATVGRAVDGWDAADVDALARGLVRLRANLTPPAATPAADHHPAVPSPAVGTHEEPAATFAPGHEEHA